MKQQMCKITIQGTEREYPRETTFQQIADEYQSQMENDFVLVKFQQDLRELHQSVLRDGDLEFITTAEKPGRDTYRRSVTLLMEAAAWKLYPNLELLVQHSIGQGYNCEFRHEDAICVKDQKMLQALKEKMQAFVEADIPIIENGGYMVDIHGNKDDRYIPGFIAIAQEKYEMTEAEAREAIKSFLVVIEDASNYLFSRNHSVPYSMIGLFIGWLRYYHKIELLTSALNVYVDNNEKMSNIKEYIKSQGLEIKGIKFGKSKAQYFMDKDENAIYQGISSIKYCNDQIADELYELSKNHYDNFVDLLSDIISKTSVDDRQLHILTTLNFFSEFGKNKYLLSIIDMYNLLGKCKTLKKDKIASLNIREEDVRKCAEKETPKQYSNVDKDKLVKLMISGLENKSLSIKEQIVYEQEYLGNIMYKNPKAPKDMYYVLECKFYKDKTKPYLMLYNMRDGEYLKTKITSGKSFIESPFIAGNVINVKEFGERNKMKKVGGDWIKTDEKERIVKKWDVY